MKNLINTITSTVAGFGLFCVACVMAGIGLAVVGLLAMFAIAAAGLALLATPLLTFLQPRDADTTQQTTA